MMELWKAKAGTLRADLLSVVLGASLTVGASTAWAQTELAEQTATAVEQVVSAAVEEQSELSAEEQAYWDQARALWESLDRQTGRVELGSAGAVLNVPENFYFLDSGDAQKVLVDVWGNMPGQPVLGMLFPMESTPFDGDAWAVIVEYEEDGYVSDEDADSIDYDELLGTMQADTREESEYRLEQGYEAIELVGWASAPFYDKTENKLHWAQELKFGDSTDNTLNYNIRVLGRRGVLVLNFIADMEQKGIIDDNLDTVLAMADFNQGSQYADFDPEIDKVAAYGIGALVAGKVLAKTGLLAMALVFFKKFGVIILIALGALAKSIFSRKNKNA